MVENIDTNALNETWARGLGLYQVYALKATEYESVKTATKADIAAANDAHAVKAKSLEIAYTKEIKKNDSVREAAVNAASVKESVSQHAVTEAINAYKAFVRETGMPDITTGMSAAGGGVTRL